MRRPRTPAPPRTPGYEARHIEKHARPRNQRWRHLHESDDCRSRRIGRAEATSLSRSRQNATNHGGEIGSGWSRVLFGRKVALEPDPALRRFTSSVVLVTVTATAAILRSEPEEQLLGVGVGLDKRDVADWHSFVGFV